jgi:hypothetical protein
MLLNQRSPMPSKSNYVRTLEHRLKYLKEIVLPQMLSNGVNVKPNKIHWVKADIAALEWAIPILKLKVLGDRDFYGKNGATNLLK